MSDRLLQNTKFSIGLAPIADAWAGGTSSDVVNMRDAKHVTWVIMQGVNAGNNATSTVTVESCDNVTPDTKTAVAFRYKVMTTNDVEGDTTWATSSGFETTAGSSQLYMIAVDDSELSGTDQYVRLTLGETVNSAVVGAILTLQTGVGDRGDDLRTAIV